MDPFDPTALRHSAWLRRITTAWDARAPERLSQWRDACSRPLSVEAVDALCDALMAPRPGEARAAATARGLRQSRQLILATLMTRDAAGEATLDEVCTAMSRFADRAVQAALDVACLEMDDRHGAPLDEAGAPIPLLVVGMGKLGAHELNVSSDIDLVFVAREQGRTAGNAEGRNAVSTAEYQAQVARRLTQLLAETDAEGFVFRVDTRLRPDGESGPLVSTLPMLENYFHAHGREWERFAWLKARVVAATGGLDSPRAVDDIDALHQVVRPFVWRRYLDFGAFAALRDLHGLIRAEARKREARRPGEIDVKLGRGGIREIEFAAQLFQIVRGGRDADLRRAATLPVLATLAARKLLPAEDCEALAQAYVFLRRVEHALQYREDAQTQVLPEHEDVRADVAGLLGTTPEALLAALAATRERVERCFDALLAPTDGSTDTGDEPSPRETAEDEALAGLAEERMTALQASARWRMARPDVRESVERLARRAVALADERGALALPRLFDLFERILGRPGYLALLERHPQAFAHLLTLLGRARWAADYLTRHPIVLDELLDGQVMAPTDWAAWEDEQRRQLLACEGDVEREMDLLREAHHAQVFRLLVQDLAGRLTVEALSDQLSELADRVLQLSLDMLWPQVRGRHRDTPAFAVVAYGRLGGKELGYASDLDLVYLYDDEHPQALESYSRLAQRLSGWLSTTTAAGILFEIDTRLRPNGNAGLLVSSVQAFARYQQEKAWTWEHQALTRARFAAGDAAVGEAFEAMRRQILALPRERPALVVEVRDMRRRMHEGHPNPSAVFDLKHDAGGMVDIEFAVQCLVLAHGHAHPELLENKGNIALLARAATAGLLDAELARRAGDAYRHYRTLQHALRLNDARHLRVGPESVVAEREAVRALWEAVLGSDAR